MAAPRILISAGEPSGDLHGAGLARVLRRRWPGAVLYGLGGNRMAEAGVSLLAHVDQLAVMGFAEVVRHLPFFTRLLNRVRRVLASAPPDLVIPIDYPGFNLRLARAARQQGIPVLYYIAPQVWAWHRSRAHKLARYTDRLAVILPFEEALFREAGAQARFVGHPLLDAEPKAPPRESFAGELGLNPARPILALFPGSRAQEVARHLGPFTAAAGLAIRDHGELQPVVAASDAVSSDAYRDSPYPLTTRGWELLYHARAALVKSGTGTLQAALAGTPMVVAYRMHPFSFAVARRVVEVEHVALVNLVAGAGLVPELIQADVTAPALAQALGPFLKLDDPARGKVVQGLTGVRARLAPPEAGNSSTVAERVADLAAEVLHDAAE